MMILSLKTFLSLATFNHLYHMISLHKHLLDVFCMSLLLLSSSNCHMLFCHLLHSPCPIVLSTSIYSVSLTFLLFWRYKLTPLKNSSIISIDLHYKVFLYFSFPFMLSIFVTGILKFSLKTFFSKKVSL